MTADDIEFFVSDELPPDEFGQREEIGGNPRTRPPLALDWMSLAAVVLLSAAATLAVLASFQTVYTIRENDQGRQSLTFGTDGWGRYQRDSSDRFDTLSGVHEIRYGIALVTCAGVLALAAAALLATQLPGPVRRSAARVRSLGAVIALTTTAMLAGVAATMALHLQSMFDTLNAQFDSIGGDFGPRPTLDTGIGACLWLALAAVVAGLLAAGALYRSRHTSDPE